MQSLLALAFALFVLCSTANPTNQQLLMRNILGLGQIPIGDTQTAITLTRTVTQTQFEINVVSTVYRTRPVATASSATVHADVRNTDYAKAGDEIREDCDTKQLRHGRQSMVSSECQRMMADGGY
jgi:hypothetical protein